MKRNKLLTSSLLYTIGNIVVQGFSFITLPIFTRYMELEDFGMFSLYSSWLAIFTIFIGLQTTGTYNIAKTKYSKTFDKYVATSLVLGTIVFIFFIVLVSIFDKYVSRILGFSTLIVKILVFHSYLLYIQGSLSQYFIQKQQSFRQFCLSIGMVVSGAILSISILFYIDKSFQGRIVGSLIPSLVVVAGYVVIIFSKTKGKIEWSYLKFMLGLSIPLIFHALGGLLLAQLDRIMIGKMIGTEQLAMYSFGYSLGVVLQTVLGGIITAWVPWLFSQKKEGNIDIIKKYQKIYISVAIFLTIGYLSVFPELSKVLGGERYSQNISFIILVIVGYFFGYLYTFPVNIQFYNENTKYIPIGTLIATVINFVLNYIFILYYGIFGAALATIISYLALLIFHHIIAKIKYNYDDIKEFDYIVSTVIILGYSLFTYIFLDNLVVRWGGCFGIFIMYIYKYRDDIKNFIKEHSKNGIKK